MMSTADSAGVAVAGMDGGGEVVSRETAESGTSFSLRRAASDAAPLAESVSEELREVRKEVSSFCESGRAAFLLVSRETAGVGFAAASVAADWSA